MDEEIIKPTYTKKPDFITGKTDKVKSYDFSCICSAGELGINFRNQIENCSNGKTVNISEEEHAELKKYYQIGQSNNSHEGGYPVFDKISCKKCSAEYYIYSGVTEFGNSAYAVQIQGIKKNG